MIELVRTMRADALRNIESPVCLFFEGENNAHKFIIEPLSGISFSGCSVTARFVRADGNQVAFNGALDASGNATVTLPAACYGVVGAFTLFIFVVDEDRTVCVYACRDQVISTVSGRTIDDDGVIIDIPTEGDVHYSATYTPAGTVSRPGFVGSPLRLSASVTPSGTVSQPSFTGTQDTVSVKGTPSGTVSRPTFTGTPSTVTLSMTPAGTVSVPNITLSGETKYVAASTTGGGSVTPGTAASIVLPTLTTSCSNGKLTITFNQGSFSPNTPTGVTLPTYTGITIPTAASASRPTFTGTQGSAAATVTPAGTVSQPTFTGEELTSTGSYTPAGTVSQPTFTGEEETVAMTGTPAGTVSRPYFTGQTATITFGGDS